MNRAVVCLTDGLAGRCSRSAVGERHVVGSPVGLGVIAALIVRCVVLWLVALDLIRETKCRETFFFFFKCANLF